MKVKNIYKKIVSIILTLMLLIPIANELELVNIKQMNSLAESENVSTKSASIDFQAIVINPGSSERDLNFTWYADTDADSSGIVQMAEYTDEYDLIEFPYEVLFEADSTSEKVQGSETYSQYYTNKASIEGLETNKKYVYRVGNEGEYSDIYTFEIKGEHTNWSFYYASDPQLNNSATDYSTHKSVLQWMASVQKITDINPDSSLFVNGGDLADRLNSTHDAQYVMGLMAPPELKNVAMAVTVGNHDQWGDGNVYSGHFNNPNQTDIGVYNNTPGDYWYTYNNALFIHLNTSTYNKYATTISWIDSHVAFIKEAIEQNPQTDWHILVMHESLFSGGAEHSATTGFVSVRNAFAPRLSEIHKTHGIDIVLGGHDHCYSRSHVMDGTNVLQELGPEDDVVVDPEGIVYITANTASGIKYYDILSPNWYYLSKMNQEKTPNVSNVEITGGAFSTSLHITTYRNVIDPYYTSDQPDMSVVDEFTITKTADNKIFGSEQELKNTGSQITVKVPNIFSQEYAKLNVRKLSSGTNYNKLTNALSKDSRLKDYKVLSTVYDASLTVEDQQVQTNDGKKEIKVYIPFPEIQDGYSPIMGLDGYPLNNMYSLDENGNAYRISNSTLETKDGILCYSFSTDKVGTYAIGIAAEEGSAVSKVVGSGGKVNVTGKTVIGETVTVEVVPDSGKEINTVKATDADGKTITTTAKGNNQYTFVMTGYKATVTVTFRDKEVTAITVKNGQKATLNVGKKLKINTTVTPADGLLTYTSNNTKVAKVSSDGNITAVGKGTAVITIKGRRGSVVKQITITVKQPVTSLTVKPKTVKVKSGNTYKIKATVKPSSANTKKLSYKSNRPKIAKVSKNGKVTAVGKTGSAKITVRTTDGSNLKATIKIQIVAKK